MTTRIPWTHRQQVTQKRFYIFRKICGGTFSQLNYICNYKYGNETRQEPEIRIRWFLNRIWGVQQRPFVRYKHCFNFTEYHSVYSCVDIAESLSSLFRLQKEGCSLHCNCTMWQLPGEMIEFSGVQNGCMRPTWKLRVSRGTVICYSPPSPSRIRISAQWTLLCVRCKIKYFSFDCVCEKNRW